AGVVSVLERVGNLLTNSGRRTKRLAIALRMQRRAGGWRLDSRGCGAELASDAVGVRVDVRGAAAQLTDDGVERAAVDELHGVKMHAAFMAHVIDGNNVGVVQLRRGVRFGLKTLQVFFIQGRRERQDLEGHSPAQ